MSNYVKLDSQAQDDVYAWYFAKMKELDDQTIGRWYESDYVPTWYAGEPPFIADSRRKTSHYKLQSQLLSWSLKSKLRGDQAMEQESDSDSDDSEASDDEVELESSLYVVPSTEDIIQACYECTSSFLLPEVPFGVDVEEEYSHAPFSSVESCYELNDLYDPPYCSENHVAQVKPGELLVGGMPRKKGPARQKGRARKRNRVPVGKRIQNVTTSYHGFPFPPEYITDITFKRTVTLTSASLYLYLKTQLNNLYDAFISGSGTNTNQLTPFRDYYFVELVMGFLQAYEIVNNESSSQLVLQRYTNTDIGTPTTTAEQRFNGDFGKSILLPGTGSQNHIKFQRKYSIPQIVGNRECLQKETFTGSSTAGPTDLVWGNLMFIGSANQTNGVRVTETLSLRVKFSGLVADQESFDDGNPPPRCVQEAEEDRRRVAKDKLAVLLAELHSPG